MGVSMGTNYLKVPSLDLPSVSPGWFLVFYFLLVVLLLVSQTSFSAFKEISQITDL